MSDYPQYWNEQGKWVPPPNRWWPEIEAALLMVLFPSLGSVAIILIAGA